MSDPNDFPEVSAGTLARFEANRTLIVSEVVERSMRRQEEVVQHGEKARQAVTTGLDFTTKALGIAMQLHNGEMLKQQLVWGADRLPHDGVALQHILTRFRILEDVIRDTLAPADAEAVNHYADYMIELQEEFMKSAIP